MYTDMQNYQQQIHRLKAVQFSTSQAETLRMRFLNFNRGGFRMKVFPFS